MIRIYIAGPMTGLPDYNRPAFHAEAKRLRDLGYHVENPAENDPPECGTWEGWMKRALRQMLTCDWVVMLPGWDRSRGAKVEHGVAIDVRLNVVNAGWIVAEHDEIMSAGKSSLATSAK